MRRATNSYASRRASRGLRGRLAHLAASMPERIEAAEVAGCHEHGEVWEPMPLRPWQCHLVMHRPWVVTPEVHERWLDRYAFTKALLAWAPKP